MPAQIKRIALFCGIPLSADAGGRFLVRPVFWRIGLLARRLVKQGYEVRVFAPSYNYYGSEKSLVVEGVPVECIGLANLPYSPFVTGKPRLLRYIWEVLKSLPRTRSALRRFSPDIVHVFTTFGYSIATGLFLKASGYTVAIDIDDAINGQMEKNGYPGFLLMIQRLLDYRVPRLFNGITVCSEFLKERVGGKAVRLPNMAGEEFFVPHKPASSGRVPLEALPLTGRMTCVMAGSIDGIQGHEHIINEVIPRVVAECPDAHFMFIGEGKALEPMRALAQEIAPGRVTFTGYIDHARIPDMLAACDIGLLPLDGSVVNAARCPLKLFEYQAAGLAVVASAVGEAEYLIDDGVTGCLTEAGNWSLFAGAIVRLARDPGLRRKLGDAACRAVSRFKEDEMCGRWLDFWKGIL